MGRHANQPPASTFRSGPLAPTPRRPLRLAVTAGTVLALTGVLLLALHLTRPAADPVPLTLAATAAPTGTVPAAPTGTVPAAPSTAGTAPSDPASPAPGPVDDGPVPADPGVLPGGPHQPR